MHAFPYIYVFTNPFAWGGCDSRSTSKQDLTGLNLEFSLSYSGCLAKVKEPKLFYYLPIK